MPRLPNAADSLKDLVEDHACWVDRFAFLTTDGSSSKIGVGNDHDVVVVVAAELHIENIRDRAVRSLDGMKVFMDEDGAIIRCNVKNRKCTFAFTIRAHPANKAQSAELIRKSPLTSDDDAGEKRMEKQMLRLPLGLPSLPDEKSGNSSSIELAVQKSKEPAGTGTYPWRGGYILARQICHWASEAAEQITATTMGRESTHECIGNDYFLLLFCNGKEVLELGAGAAGLPSMTIGKIGKHPVFKGNCRKWSSLICSDGIDEIVNSLEVNVTNNDLEDCVQVQHIDWNDFLHDDIEGQSNTSAAVREAMADTIIFADCIYNDQCAIALSRTISRLLKPKGNVVGVLPDFRVGLRLFDGIMRANGFASTNIPIAAVEANGGDVHFACSGGSGRNYQLILWRHGCEANE